MLIKRVWIQTDPEIGFDPETDSADVLVEMEDGQMWQARFVTLTYLSREMELSREVASEHVRALAPIPFLALETSHVIVANLRQDAIEDVVDNLLVLGVFETVFANTNTESEAENAAAEPVL